MDMPPDELPAHHPLGFALTGAELLFPPRTGVRLWAFGSCPDLADLLGWSLVVVVQGSRLTFLGFHPDLIHEVSPCVRFFTLTGISPAILGAVDAIGEIDLVVMDDQGRIRENFRFSALRPGDLVPARTPERHGEATRMAQ